MQPTKRIIRIHRGLLSRQLGFSLVLLTLLTGAGCSSPDLIGPGTVSSTQLPWTLSLNTHAITLSTVAPYDTLQLTAVPRTVAGVALSDSPEVTWRAADSSVRVSSTGFLTARRRTTGVNVIATTVIQGVRLSDTAKVVVTNTSNPRKFAQIKLQLDPTDSAWIALQPAGDFYWIGYENLPNFKTVYFGVLDSTGAVIPSAPLELRLSNTVQAGMGFFADLGKLLTTDAFDFIYILQRAQTGVPFTVYASATVYGVTRQDSLQIEVRQPLWNRVQVVFSSIRVGEPKTLRVIPNYPVNIGVGGWVWFINSLRNPRDSLDTDSLDVVFDDPTAATPDLHPNGLNSGGGNIAAIPGGKGNNFFNPRPGARSRQFLRAGTFHWHSTLQPGVSGTIVVR